MATYSSEQIIQIETCAGLFYTPNEIKIIMGFTNDFLKDIKIENSDVYNAYWKGFYTAEMKHRQKVVATALLGSSPAQTMVETLISNVKKQRLNG